MAADVVIVGAGIVGAACARALARAGARVTVLDRGAAAAATSAHGEGNLLVSDKGPGPELELAKVSLRRWVALADELADELGPRFPSDRARGQGRPRRRHLRRRPGPACAGSPRRSGPPASRRSS